MIIVNAENDVTTIRWNHDNVWYQADLNDLIRDYESMRQVPTVDIVPVVRCKDCENYVLGVCFKIDGIYETDPDFFCAWGERREE